MDNKLKKWIFAALFTALTCVATMVIKVPTPTMGYIHPGDAVVLLSGLLLGPVYGALAAGLGSALADLFSGYLIYVPATFIIKALTAVLAYTAFHFIADNHAKKNTANISAAPLTTGFSVSAVVFSGIVGEAFMVLGYFLFEIFMLAAAGGSGFSAAGIASGIAASASGIPFNIVQGVFGTVIAAVLNPVLQKQLTYVRV